MTGPSANTSTGRMCAVCGATIARGSPHVHQAEAHVCENCFLGATGHAPLWNAAEMPYVSLSEALTAALDAREHETGLHSKRVANYTMTLAKRFSNDADTLRQVYWGALLHDIGKIGIPDAILLKHGPLTATEWEHMRQHPEIGRRILAEVPHLKQASEIVFCHEERFDGSGYPRGLRGEDIPLWARLFAIIDTLDAITSDRPYRKGLGFEVAATEIQRMSGSQFDPLAVEAFLAEENALRQMVALKSIDPYFALAIAETG